MENVGNAWKSNTKPTLTNSSKRNYFREDSDASQSSYVGHEMMTNGHDTSGVGKRTEKSPEAVNNEYKFIVLVEATLKIGTNTCRQECVGTALTENKVVTAGHCVQPDLKSNAKVSEVNVFLLALF